MIFFVVNLMCTFRGDVICRYPLRICELNIFNPIHPVLTFIPNLSYQDNSGFYDLLRF